MSCAELRRILLIEDDSSVRNILLTLLAGLGCDSELAYSGKAAIAKIQSEEFDAVVLDLRCYNVQAEEVITGIRSIQPSLLANVLVIVGEVTNPKTLDLIEEHLLPRVSGRPVQDAVAALRALLHIPPILGKAT